MNKNSIFKITFSSIMIAMAMVLPFLTGQIPEIGAMLCPLHIPVIICGLICGWKYGLVCGFVVPLLRSAIFGMPPMYPTAISMCFELATYGFICGILFTIFVVPEKENKKPVRVPECEGLKVSECEKKLHDKGFEVETIYDEFEKEHNAYVYLLFDTHEPFEGEVLVFFIKNDAKDWLEQSEDIKKNNSLICYVAKSDDLYSGEFKRVCLKKNESGVVLRVK